MCGIFLSIGAFRGALQIMAVAELDKHHIGRGLHALITSESSPFSNLQAFVAAGGMHKIFFYFLFCSSGLEDRLCGKQRAAFPFRRSPAAKLRESLHTVVADAKRRGISLQHGLSAIVTMFATKMCYGIRLFHLAFVMVSPQTLNSSVTPSALRHWLLWQVGADRFCTVRSPRLPFQKPRCKRQCSPHGAL